MAHVELQTPAEHDTVVTFVVAHARWQLPQCEGSAFVWISHPLVGPPSQSWYPEKQAAIAHVPVVALHCAVAFGKEQSDALQQADAAMHALPQTFPLEHVKLQTF
jgi:hypothetical protein